MAKKRRKSKVEQQKKKILLESILDKWVCVKQIIDDEEKYIFIKHRLRDENSYNRIEQTIIGPDPYECGVYYITDFDIDNVFDWARNKEMIEIRPVRYDLEIGLYSEKEKITSYEELKEYLINKNYITHQDIKRFANFETKPPGMEEILLGYDSKKKSI